MRFKLRLPKLVLLTAMCFLVGTLAVFSGRGIEARADDGGDPAVYYRHAALEGRVITYDPDRDLFIVFGSYEVDAGDGWQTINSSKFHRVRPANDAVRQFLLGRLDQGAQILGSYEAWAGQSEEVFDGTSAGPLDQAPASPVWYAFGKTIRPERIAKFNLYTANDFVRVLAGLKDALAAGGFNLPPDRRLTAEEITVLKTRVENPASDADRTLLRNVRSWWENNWNLKWAVEKNTRAYNELAASVGGSTFYVGRLGVSNCYIMSAPVTRKDIDAFMAAAKEGSGAADREEPVAMFARVTAERDRTGRITALYASGPLFVNPYALIYDGIKNNAAPAERWRLEGWSQDRAEQLDGRRVWLEGRTVLVRDDKGNVVDRYLALGENLTQDEFNTVLDLNRELIGDGGI